LRLRLLLLRQALRLLAMLPSCHAMFGTSSMLRQLLLVLLRRPQTVRLVLL
jgi:hypothetical protein